MSLASSYRPDVQVLLDLPAVPFPSPDNWSLQSTLPVYISMDCPIYLSVVHLGSLFPCISRHSHWYRMHSAAISIWSPPMHIWKFMRISCNLFCSRSCLRVFCLFVCLPSLLLFQFLRVDLEKGSTQETPLFENTLSVN